MLVDTTAPVDTNLSLCLRGAHCEASAPCLPEAYIPRSCLTTHIPMWGVPAAHVQCCMRCCLLSWVQRLGLEDNARHWARTSHTLVDSVSSGTGHLASMRAASIEDGLDEGRRRHAGTAAPGTPLDSVLYFRFSLARFAHVQAVALADWRALVAQGADVRSPRFSSPSAPSARSGLVCLNGFGHILGNKRLAYLNISIGRRPDELPARDESTIMHSTTPPSGGGRVVFPDPLHSVLRGALQPHGAHAVLYGDDKSIGVTYLERVHRTLGGTLHRYFAPNLTPESARLPYATQVPLGLNHNSYSLAGTLYTGGLLDAAVGYVGRRHASRAHRRPSLLCCCQRLYDHRARIAHQLNRSGFDCGMLLAGEEDRTWEQTMSLYAEHRFVLAMHGRGNQDFRVWEILLAGAVPVMERFDEQDELLEGLPVVRVANWSELTPASLHGEWVRVLRGVQNGSLSWTKLYLPFWLSQFTAHILPGLR